jgi:hypothetical protein
LLELVSVAIYRTKSSIMMCRQFQVGTVQSTVCTAVGRIG